MIKAGTEQDIFCCRMPLYITHSSLVSLQFNQPIVEMYSKTAIRYVPKFDLKTKYQHYFNKTFVEISTVQSSEQDAMTLSLKGFHLMSKTGPLWPVTLLALKSSLPV